MQKIRVIFQYASTLLGVMLKYNVAILRSFIFCVWVLPFKQAIRVPIFISNQTRYTLKNLKGKGVIILGPIHLGMIKIGFTQASFFSAKQNSSFIEINQGTISFDGYANIGAGCKLSVCSGGTLRLGNQFWSTGPITIIARKSIVIGNSCCCSWDIYMMDHDAHEIYKSEHCINSPSEIIIKDHCWIGFKTSILKGVNIESDVIVAANSVVTKSVLTKNSIVAGVPAIIKKTEVTW